MKRYSEYKDSGVKWIGEIPGHWEIRRLKNVVLCNAETLSENFPKDEVIKYVEISDVNYTSGITNIQRMPFGEAPSRARRITKKNDVIVSTVRTYLKAVAKIQEDGLIVSTGFAVLHPLIGNSSFLSYFALSESFIHNVIVNSKGISYPAITASDLICIAMPLPPLSEQEAIVTYLDSKVDKIDEYISIAEKKIAALEELKQTIIAEAVTRGIHKDVPMKDSGVKWIGMIPEHWDCCKLKYFTRIKSGDALTNNALSDTGKYKVYGGGDFMGFYDKYNVDANTILIGRVGARCGCVTITEEKAWATDNALILIHFNINT